VSFQYKLFQKIILIIDEQSDVDLILLLDLACKRQEGHAPIPYGSPGLLPMFMA
jgi:hypothetical protein